MARVDIRDLEKNFGDTHVLKGVNLDIEDGQFVVLVGPSGCGKSTLLRVIAGLEDPSEGSVRIGNTDVTDMHPKDRDIAMVFQNYGLYPHMSVRENMGYALKLKRVDRVQINQLVEEAAATLNLDELLDRLPRQLSGGQRQRVAMGRAIVRDPKVFLFDEPLSNLDAKLRVQMRVEIRRLHQRLGVTTVYVTHDQIEAMTMADTIVAMQDGIVKQTGSPLELYDRPANIFVAGFIGSPAMNLFQASVSANGLELTTGEVLPVTNHDSIIGHTVIAGVRPEDLLLADHGVPARIVLAEHTGSEIHVTASLGEAGNGEDVTILVRERTELHPGQAVRLKPRCGHVHFFDPDTRDRINSV